MATWRPCACPGSRPNQASRQCCGCLQVGDKQQERAAIATAQDAFARQVEPHLRLVALCGNTYCGVPPSKLSLVTSQKLRPGCNRG